jgi:hypothetical protein
MQVYTNSLKHLRKTSPQKPTRNHDLIPSLCLIIMWGSRPLLTVSTTDRSALTLQRLYTFTTARVKVPKNFEPNHACADQAQYQTTEVWLHRDATKPLQRYAEDQQPATVTAAERTITLPSGQYLSKGCGQEDQAIPLKLCPPMLLSDKAFR